MRALVDRLHDAVIAREPDLTFVIDMDPAEALRRGLARQSGEDRFEEMGEGFQERLRAGFTALATDHPDRCYLINGARDPDEIAADIAHLTVNR